MYKRQVVVSANPVSANSGITGTGSYSLTVGNNAFKINCKSQSGDTRTYTINIDVYKRQALNSCSAKAGGTLIHPCEPEVL